MADPKTKVILTAEDRTKRAFVSAQKRLEGLRKSAALVGQAFAAIGTAAAAVIAVNQLTERIRSLSLEIDFLIKSADRLGIAFDEFQKLEFAAALAGVSLEQLNIALRQLNKNVTDFARGTGEALIGFKALRLTANDFVGLGVDEQLLLVADAMGEIDDKAVIADAAMRIFGESGTLMAELLSGGREEIELLGEELESIGLISRKQAESFEALENANVRLSFATRSLKADMAPVIVFFASLTEKAGVLTTAFDTLKDKYIELFQTVFGGKGATGVSPAVAEKAFVGPINGVNAALVETKARLDDLPGFDFDDMFPLRSIGEFRDATKEVATVFQESIIPGLNDIDTELLRVTESVRAPLTEFENMHDEITLIAGTVRTTLGGALAGVFQTARAEASLFEQVMLDIISNLAQQVLNQLLGSFLTLLGGPALGGVFGTVLSVFTGNSQRQNQNSAGRFDFRNTGSL